MLMALALAASMRNVAIEARHYSIELVGPMYTALINWGNIEDTIKGREAWGPRTINVYIAGERMRCDTARVVSVIKNGGEYIFLDHNKRQALVFPKELTQSGKEAACSTTPFWPEAYGDSVSASMLEQKAKANSAILEKGDPSRFEKVTDWFYVPFSAKQFDEREKSGISWHFRLSTTPSTAIPNTRYSCRDMSSPILLEVVWWADNEYAPGVKEPAMVAIAESYFAIPDGYMTLVPQATGSRPDATVLDPVRVKRFIAGFPIPAALPKTLLPGRHG